MCLPFPRESLAHGLQHRLGEPQTVTERHLGEGLFGPWVKRVPDSLTSIVDDVYIYWHLPLQP
jgi:hypothetical protein